MNSTGVISIIFLTLLLLLCFYLMLWDDSSYSKTYAKNNNKKKKHHEKPSEKIEVTCEFLENENKFGQLYWPNGEECSEKEYQNICATDFRADGEISRAGLVGGICYGMNMPATFITPLYEHVKPPVNSSAGLSATQAMGPGIIYNPVDARIVGDSALAQYIIDTFMDRLPLARKAGKFDPPITKFESIEPHGESGWGPDSYAAIGFPYRPLVQDPQWIEHNNSIKAPDCSFYDEATFEEAREKTIYRQSNIDACVPALFSQKVASHIGKDFFKMTMCIAGCSCLSAATDPKLFQTPFKKLSRNEQIFIQDINRGIYRFQPEYTNKPLDRVWEPERYSSGEPASACGGDQCSDTDNELCLTFNKYIQDGVKNPGSDSISDSTFQLWLDYLQTKGTNGVLPTANQRWNWAKLASLHEVNGAIAVHKAYSSHLFTRMWLMTALCSNKSQNAGKQACLIKFTGTDMGFRPGSKESRYVTILGQPVQGATWVNNAILGYNLWGPSGLMGMPKYRLSISKKLLNQINRANTCVGSPGSSPTSPCYDECKAIQDNKTCIVTPGCYYKKKSILSQKLTGEKGACTSKASYCSGKGKIMCGNTDGCVYQNKECVKDEEFFCGGKNLRTCANEKMCVWNVTGTDETGCVNVVDYCEKNKQSCPEPRCTKDPYDGSCIPNLNDCSGKRRAICMASDLCTFDPVAGCVEDKCKEYNTEKLCSSGLNRLTCNWDGFECKTKSLNQFLDKEEGTTFSQEMQTLNELENSMKELGL